MHIRRAASHYRWNIKVSLLKLGIDHRIVWKIVKLYSIARHIIAPTPFEVTTSGDECTDVPSVDSVARGTNIYRCAVACGAGVECPRQPMVCPSTLRVTYQDLVLIIGFSAVTPTHVTGADVGYIFPELMTPAMLTHKLTVVTVVVISQQANPIDGQWVVAVRVEPFEMQNGLSVSERRRKDGGCQRRSKEMCCALSHPSCVAES